MIQTTLTKPRFFSLDKFLQSYLFLILAFFMGSSFFCSAQLIKVEGLVLSEEDNLPIIGASVLLKETGKGTITDIDGRFFLSPTEKDKTVLISYIGMETQELPISAIMKIVLKNKETALDELVVIGYGSGRRKEALVGAVSSINDEKLKNKPVTNVLESLQGSVSGLNVLSDSGEPSASPKMSLRGVGSLSAGNTPLLLLDGVPISSSFLNSINNNDIASVTILKDASATSIYGARASNGVILVSSKRGQSNEKAIISLNSYLGFSSLAQENLGNPMSANELLDYQLRNKVINQEFYDTRKKEGYNTNWRDYYFDKNAPTYSVDLSLRGGTPKMIYFLSTGYFEQKGTAPGSWMKKYNGRLNLENQLNDWLRIGTNLFGSYSVYSVNKYTSHNSSTSDGGLFASVLSQPYYSPIDPETDKPYWEKTIPGVNILNPRYVADKEKNINNRTQFNGNAFVQIKPFEGLTLKSLVGLEATDGRNTARTYPSFVRAKGIGNVLEGFERSYSRIITNTAEYLFTLKDQHNITALVGQEGIDSRRELISQKTEGQSDDRLMLLTAGTQVKKPSHKIDEYAYLSFFNRMEYNFDERYFLTFSLRKDGSSRFGEGNRWATFYSGALMWDLKKESFFNNLNSIDALRVKASVGSTGNSSFSNYESLAFVAEKSKYNAKTAWVLNNSGNKDLSWEKQITYNLGLNIDLLRKLKIDFNLYNRVTKDMLMYIPVEATTGFSYSPRNVGKMSNRGLEIELDYHVFQNKVAYFKLNKVFSYNINKVEELYNDQTEWILPFANIAYRVGHSQGFFVPVYHGVNPKNGKQLWEIPNSGAKTTEEFDLDLLAQAIPGKSHIPPISGGFSLEGGYKAFSLRTDFSYVIGKYMFNTDRYFFENSFVVANGQNGSKSLLSEWQKAGDDTMIPKFGEQVEFDSRFLENASFLRMKNITLSYALPDKIAEKTKLFNSLKLYLSGRNLFTYTRYKGADPEIPMTENRGDYPNSRQLIFGLNLLF